MLRYIIECNKPLSATIAGNDLTFHLSFPFSSLLELKLLNTYNESSLVSPRKLFSGSFEKKIVIE